MGLFLVYLEFFFPSGILGVMAAAGLMTSIIAFAFQGHAWGWIALYSIVLLMATGVVCMCAFSKVRKKISLESDQEGFVAASYDEKLIGKEGVVLTDLKPSGDILIEGVRLAAFADSGYLSKDTPVVVIGGRGSMLVVKGK